MRYAYTKYNQDGTIEFMGSYDQELPFNSDPDKNIKGLYDWLDCSMIESIPDMYWPDGWTNDTSVVWGDEEGRFSDNNYRNPHMKVLRDAAGSAWDCVGNLIRVQEV